MAPKPKRHNPQFDSSRADKRAIMAAMLYDANAGRFNKATAMQQALKLADDFISASDAYVGPEPAEPGWTPHDA